MTDISCIQLETGYTGAVFDMQLDLHLVIFFFSILYHTQKIRNREQISKDEISTFIFLSCA